MVRPEVVRCRERSGKGSSHHDDPARESPDGVSVGAPGSSCRQGPKGRLSKRSAESPGQQVSKHASHDHPTQAPPRRPSVSRLTENRHARLNGALPTEALQRRKEGKVYQ